MSEQRIQRYFMCGDPDSLGGSMKESDDGTYVTFADHAARVAELEQQVEKLQQALWRWHPGVFDDQSADDAMLLMGYEGPDTDHPGEAIMQAKDRAERMHADYLACEEPAAVSDPDLIALLPVWAGKWINDLKAASAQHMLQALNNGQSARLQRERADRAERRLGEVRAAFVEMGEIMAGMYQAAGEHEKARVLRQKLNELKDQPA